MKTVPLGKVSTINPRKPRALDADQLCSFVPMDRVDDYSGQIVEATSRPIGEVQKGYTFFADRDVLFAKITPCMENGKCAIADDLIGGLGFGSTEFHVLRASDSIVPEWIYYFLRQENTRQQAKIQMTGSAGQQRVPASFLESLPIPLPPLDEQQRIAGILSRADRLRRLRRYALEMSEGYLQAVFLEMFGDFFQTNRWKTVKLEKLAEVVSGVTKGQRFNGRATVEVPYLRVANVQDGYLDLSEVKSIEALPSDVAKYQLQQGDILMTEGGDFDKLGRGAIWEGQVANCIHQNHIFRVRLDQKAVLPRFFGTLLMTQYTKSYFLRASKKTTNLATINMGQLKAFEVPVPAMKMQQKFVSVSVQYERLRAQQREALRQAEHLFQGLLQGAFRGEV